MALEQNSSHRIRVIYWIYGIRSPRLYRTRELDWTIMELGQRDSIGLEYTRDVHTYVDFRRIKL